jgi:hypothetical protein
MANRHEMTFRATFRGGSRDGLVVEGAEAYAVYLATDNGTIGGQFKDLSRECKERIRAEGFVAVHLAGGIEREVYEVINLRTEPPLIAITCKLSHVER